MGLFNAYLGQTFELTEKQILLEYGDIFIERETMEKAVKLGSDKWIFTNYRLLLVLACKGGRYESQSIPYSTIRKFSMIKSASEHDAELNLYLQDEPKPIRKVIKSVEVVNEIYRILARRILNVSQQVSEMPMVKLNQEQIN